MVPRAGFAPAFVRVWAEAGAAPVTVGKTVADAGVEPAISSGYEPGMVFRSTHPQFEIGAAPGSRTLITDLQDR